ncbi:MAG: oligosaccharide flippase family protein [Microcoleus sp. SIO2G3]|nr:oligosaccharide flippase family protein [Microcoleus sp. SIO2G3]
MFKRLVKKLSGDGDQSSLKRRAIQGSVWTIIGHGSSQVLRLVGNLILTRLLFPEAFGLMALVQTFMTGLEMFSDVGIYPSIIQNKRGDDPAFLNTAWTIQVFRGFMLWLCACLIAWPASQFFREPMLVQLLPAVGITSFIAGLNSTKMPTANRKLQLGRLTALELGSYVLGLVVMIILAWVYKSVWSLVAGGIVSGLTKMILSHVFLEGEQNRLHWDRESFKELNRFGRWIFISTVMGFLASQGDRLVLARLLDVRFLGIYTVALTLSLVIQQVVGELSNKVLFASYSEIIRERPERLYPVLRKNRIILAAIGTAVSLFFVLFGEVLINFLYDDRYVQAGWMLQVLAVGMVVRPLNLTSGDVLMAKGKASVIAGLIGTKILIQFTAMFVGGQLAGPPGVIIGIAAIDWLMYPIEAVCFARFGIWQPEVDFPVLALGAGMAAIVYFS